MKFNTIRFKISLLYTTILGIVVIIYTAVLYITLSYNLYDDFDRQLMDKVKKIETTIDSYLNILGHDEQSLFFSVKKALNLDAQHPRQHKVKDLEDFWLKIYHSLQLGKDYIIVTDRAGRSIARSANLSEQLDTDFSKTVKQAGMEKTVTANIKLNDLDFRVLSVSLNINNNKSYNIHIASSLKSVHDFMITRLYYRIIPIPFVLLCGYFIGLIFVARMLKPVAEVTALAERITYKDLSQRVNTKHTDDEMQALANAFNDMIARLEKSFTYIAEFSSHVSHELKTPLAIIRGEMELCLKKKRKSQEYQRVLDVSLEEIARMLKLIDDLLLLTRLDYRPDFLSFKKIDVRGFLREIHEQSKILAVKKNITVTMRLPKGRMAAYADTIHLRRLFFNLLDNAVKFTSAGGKIAISVKREQKKLLISITDTGTGIKPGDLEKIFDKFFCGQARMQSDAYGSGLGLSIVQSIAKIHKADIDVKSRIGEGTTFTVILPLI
ncbi:MAG: HAMP domain-containing protein [Spirochaetales bacterium]|nr:HAMP domain-containing protein [Spirochaetales bacterium]